MQNSLIHYMLALLFFFRVTSAAKLQSMRQILTAVTDEEKQEGQMLSQMRPPIQK